MFRSYVFLFGLLWAGVTASSVLQVYETSRWPIARGTVLTSFVRTDTVGFARRDRWGHRSPIVERLLHVTYAYAVGDQQYTGSRLSILPATQGTSASPWKLADYPVGRGVLVHYNPDDRAEAVIDTSPWYSVMLTLLGCGIAAGALFGMRQRPSGPGAKSPGGRLRPGRRSQRRGG